MLSPMWQKVRRLWTVPIEVPRDTQHAKDAKTLAKRLKAVSKRLQKP